MMGQFVVVDGPSGITDRKIVPGTFSLGQNLTNPFNPTTVISYQLLLASVVMLKVYDVIGRELRTVVNGPKNAGSYTVRFDDSNLPSGIYFYQLQSGEYTATKKLVLIK